MFGYIKPFRPELKVRELDEYKAVYCGLCHQLGKSFSFIARMTLSYDFAFLAMFLISLDTESCPEYEKCRCIAHPFKSRNCIKNEKAISFSADTAAILMYYKLLDDMKDHGIKKKLAAFILIPFAASWRKKALKAGGMSDIDAAAHEMMEKQAKLENECCSSSDRAAEPTAEFLSIVLKSGAPSCNEIVLGRIGYLIGRYIYLCDAMDDLEDDKKKSNYNPFLYSEGNSLSEAKGALFLTVSELGDDIDLIDLGQFSGIVNNIIKIGLRSEVLRIENKGESGIGTESV